jgi:hypothetical protein
MKGRTMVKTLTVFGILAALTLFNITAAEARAFEPQANWWSSGRTCVATRSPPGRRWRALPPRPCTRLQEPRLDAALTLEIRAPSWQDPSLRSKHPALGEAT